VFGGIAGAGALALKPRNSATGRTSLHVALGGAAASIVFLLSVARLMAYYFEVLFVCLAPLAAFALMDIAGRAADAVRLRSPARAIDALGLCAILLLGVLHPRILDLSDITTEGQYTWRGSGVAVVDSIVRPLVFHEEIRRGQHYSAGARYLAQSFHVFEGAEPLASRVRERTDEADTVFGDSTSTPLIVLLADRRIAFDDADTNLMRYAGGRDSIPALLERLEASPPNVIVGQDGWGLYSNRSFVTWVHRHYDEDFRYIGSDGTTSHRLFVLKPDSGSPPDAPAPGHRR